MCQVIRNYLLPKLKQVFEQYLFFCQHFFKNGCDDLKTAAILLLNIFICYKFLSYDYRHYKQLIISIGNRIY